MPIQISSIRLEALTGILTTTTATQEQISKFKKDFAHVLAYTIAHESSHSFGLRHTFGSTPGNEKMATLDIIHGGVTPDQHIQNLVVTRATLDLDPSPYLGIPPGTTNNNYNQFILDPDIGFVNRNVNLFPQVADFAYVTGTGAHDTITLTADGTVNGHQKIKVVVNAYSDPSHSAASLIHSFDYPIVLGVDTEGGIRIDASMGDDVVTVASAFNLNVPVTVYGGQGDDSITGGAGDAWLYGEDDNDTIVGGAGVNHLYGGDGNDTLTGHDLKDFEYGGKGRDILIGNGGDDKLHGGEGDDSLLGGGGTDTLHGRHGDDTLHGGDNDDYLYGEIGNDWLYGEIGNDWLYGMSGVDFLDGGNNDDRLFGEGDHDTLYGRSGNDTLYGGDSWDLLNGGEDNDKLYGEIGDDRLFGDGGNDTLFGGDGMDMLGGDGDQDTLSGSYDSEHDRWPDFVPDTLDGGTGIDEIRWYTYDHNQNLEQIDNVIFQGPTSPSSTNPLTPTGALTRPRSTPSRAAYRNWSSGPIRSASNSPPATRR